MSDLLASWNRLEVEFSEAFDAHGDGGNLVFAFLPVDVKAPDLGPVTITGELPRHIVPDTTWAQPFGRCLLTDHAGQPHWIVIFAAGTSSSSEPYQAFRRLARRAGSACFRLPRGMAATGPSSAPELNWLGTVYSYLKGTAFIVEGPGFSRLQSVFSASIEVLSLINRGDVNGNAPAHPGSLRPGIPGVDGDICFEFAPLDSAPPTPAPHSSEPVHPAPPAQSAARGGAVEHQTSAPPEQQSGVQELKPDEFRFGLGQVGGDFTTKQLRLLRLLEDAGAGGVAIADACRELGYGEDERGRKAIGQLVARTQEKIDGRAPYLIELVNGRYCLTCTATRP